MKRGKKMKKEKVKITFIQAIAVILIILLIAAGIITIIIKNHFEKNAENGKQIVTGKIDDWEYDPQKARAEYGYNYNSKGISSGAVMESATADSYLGFSTGGAKDINNFRENIENGYFPISTDITYNGLFYDYTFDTGNNSCDGLFGRRSPLIQRTVNTETQAHTFIKHFQMNIRRTLRNSLF